MNQFCCRTRLSNVSRNFIVAGTLLLCVGCTQTTKKPQETRSEPSKISVAVNSGGPIVLSTRTAEFQILPSGYLQASLLKGDQKLRLDEPRKNGLTGSDYLVQQGNEIHFNLDFAGAKITEANGKIGRGKHVDIHDQTIITTGAL